MTACVTAPPSVASAVSFILVRMKALIWLGLYFLPRTSTQASPLSPRTMWYGTMVLSFAVIGSS
ncbi:hypothetical protein ACVWZK_009108 [Bradyrhizobium sp. GM0.4]